MYHKMNVDGIVLDDESKLPLVILTDESSRWRLPVQIGMFEAVAIVFGIEGTKSDRPLTHDLMKSIIENFSGEIKKLNIDKLVDGVFYSNLHIKTMKGDELLIDCRPSDGLALALRAGVEIFAEESVLKAGGVEVLHDEIGSGEHDVRSLEYLETLDKSAFGKYKM